MNRKIFTILFCTFTAINATLSAQSYSGGSGTEADPYRISSKTDMEALATAVNGGNNYSGKYFLLTQDITDAVTTVIGDYNTTSRLFSGTFDGGGHQINVNISTTASYFGVFGYASGATIKNLGITGSVTRTSANTNAYAGGVCGYANNITITNCYNTGNISSSSYAYSSSYYSYAGGICGYGYNNTTITNCYNTGNISSSSYSSSSYAGGICGYVGTITNCYNTGNISSSSSFYSSNAGGICGYFGTITNCIAANAIITASNNSADAGRIVGNGGTIQNCYALTTMQINGTTRSSQDENSQDGKDSNIITYSSSTCSHSETNVMLFTINPLKWQYSINNGNTWGDIACTSPFYTETNPSAGHYIYRAQNGDGTFSPYVEVTYNDAIPSTINTLPLTDATKTVDESMSFSLELTDDNYNYQWYKDNVAIPGATSAGYSIPVVKSANAGVYFCRVWNGCNSVDSEHTTLTVNKAPQVITFPEIPAKTYGDDAVTLPEKTDKGLTITYQSVNTNVATVAGNVITLKNPGASTIIASQAGDADYLLAASVERTLTVNKQAQTITFGEIAAKRYGDPAFTLPATTDKGLTISYQAINTNVATVQGNTVTILNTGATDIVASQAGDDFRYAATPVTQTLSVSKANQSITFNNFDSKIYGDPDIVLNQYSDAGLEITYASDNASVATVSGNTVVLHNAGSAQITATQAGNGNYNAATSITRTLVIGKAGQTIVWDNIDPKTYGDNDFYLPATTDKGMTITYSAANENIATVAGNKVHITGAGTTNITATQAGNDNYFPASSVTLPLTVSKAFQTITFSALPEKTFGDPTLTLQASVTSNLAIVFESSNTSVATVSGNTLTILNAGMAYITASVAGDNNYYAANPVQQQLTVNKAAQTIALDFVPDKTYGDAAFTLSAQTNTGLSVTYTSSDPSKVFVSGSQAFIFGAGNVTLTAQQAGNSNYLPVSDNQTVVVNKANLTVSAENKERYYGDANPALTYTFTGFVNGDSRVDLQTLPNIACPATPISFVGNYPITVSGAVDNNYNFIYQQAQLTINKAVLTVKPNDASRKYGDNNPTFVLGYSGFKNNETESILTEKPVAITNAKATSDVGVYDILVSGGSAINYDFSYLSGKLTIDKALLNVIVDNKQREYGDANPQFTYSFTGFKNSDTQNDIDALPAVSCAASLSSPVGAYDITAQTASAKNYEFTYFKGTLAITKAPLTITVEDAQRKQGEGNPLFTLLFSGFKNNENEAVLDVFPDIYCAANIYSAVGFYDIVLSGGSDNNYNYILVNGKLEVTSATGLAEINASKISVYPNPAKHYLYIKSDSPIKKIEIYNQSGICVLTNENVMEKLDISRLANGVYFVRIYTEEGSATKKIVVKRN